MAISRSKRDIGLDITRIIAFIQVPCIHFLLKIKYYNQAIIRRLCGGALRSIRSPFTDRRGRQKSENIK